MKILRNDNDLSITLNTEQHFKTDLGWKESAQEFEQEALEKIINPIENYETVRYIHEPYVGSIGNVQQTDIYFHFKFISGNTYVIDYEPTGLSANENAQMNAFVSKSFFRLEFYKTPSRIINNVEVTESPDRANRRLVFAKNLSLPSGEKFFYTVLNDFIFKPVFCGSNYKNTENMYLFWFQDESAFNETTLTGNTFWMSAKFFNGEDGSITDFVKSDIGNSDVVETNDMYYKMVIDKSDYSYQIFRYENGVTGNRIGKNNDPIEFYEKKG